MTDAPTLRQLAQQAYESCGGDRRAAVASVRQRLGAEKALYQAIVLPIVKHAIWEAVDAVAEEEDRRANAQALAAERTADRKRRMVRAKEQQRRWQSLKDEVGMGSDPDATPGDVLMACIEAYTDQMKAKWTRELLASEFSLPDGSVVQWGTATASQHRERSQELSSLAERNIEDAARHMAAVRDIESHGAACLNDCVRDEVAA